MLKGPKSAGLNRVKDFFKDSKGFKSHKFELQCQKCKDHISIFQTLVVPWKSGTFSRSVTRVAALALVLGKFGKLTLWSVGAANTSPPPPEARGTILGICDSASSASRAYF